MCVRACIHLNGVRNFFPHQQPCSFPFLFFDSDFPSNQTGGISKSKSKITHCMKWLSKRLACGGLNCDLTGIAVV